MVSYGEKKKKKQRKRFQKQNKTTKKQTIEIRKEDIVLTFHSNLNNENHSSLESIIEIYFGSLGVVSKQNFWEEESHQDRPEKDKDRRMRYKDNKQRWKGTKVW